MKLSDKTQCSTSNVVSLKQYTDYKSSRKKPMNDAQLMSEIGEYIVRIRDPFIKKKLFDSWRENAANLGVSKFKSR